MYFSRTSVIAVFLFLHLVEIHKVFGETKLESFGLDKDVTVAKCCPRGEIFYLDSLGRGENCAKSEKSWNFTISGKNSTALIDSKILVYDNRSKVREHII